MDDVPATFAADPLAVPGARGDSPVQGLGPLGDDPRQAGGRAFDEWCVELGGVLLAETDVDVDVRAAQVVDAAAGNAGVGVDHGDVDLGDPGVDDRVGAGGRLGVVAAGFEVDVEGGGGGVAAGGGAAVQCVNLGVGRSEAVVISFGEDLAVAHEDGADHGIRLDAALASLGQGDRSAHVLQVGRHKNMVPR